MREYRVDIGEEETSSAGVAQQRSAEQDVPHRPASVHVPSYECKGHVLTQQLRRRDEACCLCPHSYRHMNVCNLLRELQQLVNEPAAHVSCNAPLEAVRTSHSVVMPALLTS